MFKKRFIAYVFICSIFIPMFLYAGFMCNPYNTLHKPGKEGGGGNLLVLKKLYWAINYHFGELESNSWSIPIEKVVKGIYAFIRTEYYFEKNDRSRTPLDEYLKQPLIDLHGLILNVCDNRVNNDIIKLRNGMLEFKYSEFLLPLDDKLLCQYADSFLDFQKALAKEGISLLYLQIPHKIHKIDTQLPYGLVSFLNPDTDFFLELLKERGVDYYDSRQLFIDNPNEHYRLFYPGDHHWRPEYAFYTFQKIMPLLKEKYGFPDDCDLGFRHLEDYSIKKTPFHFTFGSQQRRVGRYYRVPDDDKFLLIPKKETLFTLSVPSENIEKTGTFSDVFLIHNVNHPLQIAENHHQPNGKKILIIKDSFALPLFDFFALTCQKIEMIDLRAYHDNLLEHIQKTKPDIVIIAYNPSMLPNSIMFRFLQP